MSNLASVASVLFRGVEVAPLRSSQSEKQGEGSKESVDSNGLWAALAFVLFMPGMIAGYNSIIEHVALRASVDPSCVDPFNIAIGTIPLPKLDSDGSASETTGVPVCVWNLTHISFYAFVTHRLRCFFRRRWFNESIVNVLPAHHIGAMLLGVGWFFAEPYIFSASDGDDSARRNSCRAMGWDVVYDSTWRPRREDLYFNLLGQMLIA